METFVGIVFIIVCVLLIIVVLLQKGRGGGLGAAFGGAGNSAFGTRTGDVFTWITIVLTVLFLLLAVFATLAFRPDSEKVLPLKLSPLVETGVPAEGQEITIYCQTDGARIAYTTDGSDPLEENAIDSPSVQVFVTPGLALKAQAFADKRRPSDPLSVTYGLAQTDKPVVPKPTTQPDAATQPAGAEAQPAGAS